MCEEQNDKMRLVAIHSVRICAPLGARAQLGFSSGVFGTRATQGTKLLAVLHYDASSATRLLLPIAPVSQLPIDRAIVLCLNSAPTQGAAGLRGVACTVSLNGLRRCQQCDQPRQEQRSRP